ncbi:hypothetical protein KIW84_075484 [Lathyrus oleraceus]|uniref:Uncharacterized protein n=1 Tax=Pisum sativum TaxID=3888 RepID=A0A9D4VU23_PEA|nr:hypothetical protein KIW84_075484 [Pisum sativum]
MNEVSSGQPYPQEDANAIPNMYEIALRNRGPNQFIVVMNRKLYKDVLTIKGKLSKSQTRYWTTWGAIRNIPIGVSKRRNKHLPLQNFQVPITDDAVPVVHTDYIPASHKKEVPLSESNNTN